jgi:hypothetical protein
VATRIREAEAGRDQILDETRGLVTRYKSWLEQYKRSPDLVKARLRQEMIADLFDTEDESIPTIWIVDDKSGSYLFLGPDPAAIQRRWQQDMKRKSEQK